MAEQLDLLPRPDPSPKKRSTDQQWLDWAAGDWEQFHGRKPTIRWARDLALIKPLLRLHGEEELKLRWSAFVRTMDEYLARRGWNVPCFAECVDRFDSHRDRAELVRRWLQHQANRRDPLTGISLRFLRG